MKKLVRSAMVIALASAWPAVVNAVDIGPRRMTLPNENLAKESYLTVPAGDWVFAMSYEYEMLKNVYTGSKETSNSSNSFTLNNTLALDITYGLSDNITLNAIVPYKYVFNTRRVDSSLVSGTDGIFFTDRRGSQGLGDIVIMSYLRIHFGQLIRFGDEYYPTGDDGYDDYMSSGPSEYAGRHQGPIFALALGARIPTGNTDITDSRNQRLPDNLQLGTGTMDPIAGILYHQRYYRLGWGLSGLYRLSSKENIYHYQWGNELIGSAYLSYRLNRSLEFVNQFNGNWMDKDTYNYVRVPTAGGTVVFYTPSLIYVGAKNMTLQASAEIPIYRDFSSSQLMSDYIINIRTSFSIR